VAGKSRAFHSRLNMKKASSSDNFLNDISRVLSIQTLPPDHHSIPRCLPRSFSTRKLSPGSVFCCSRRKYLLTLPREEEKLYESTSVLVKVYKMF
jgi:hypothetical protein